MFIVEMMTFFYFVGINEAVVVVEGRMIGRMLAMFRYHPRPIQIQSNPSTYDQTQRSLYFHSRPSIFFLYYR